VTAAIYARKSTEQNGMADEQKSVTRQIEHARAYAERKGWRVLDAHIYSDDGIGGAEFAKRPGFLRLMNALKPRPPFQILIMSEESRLGREAIETAYALKQLVQAGVRVFFYLEDRERTLETPTDKIMLSLTAFADELEREKARQRTYDAMVRKAKAGHVTGGRVFGYDNRRTEAGHVERVINRDEAAVVRRIFELCARGWGQIAIAKKLNAEHVPTPRAQQRRPSAWSSSTVREVLYRELYKGVLVWNRTRKRDTWGQVKQKARDEADWLRVPVPKLRVIPDAIWDQAHARLSHTREAYLRTTNGKLWGRPLDGAARKYLLTGLARCGQCGGSLEVRSRDHGKHRAFFYACSSYWRRGKAVCANRLEVPLRSADQAVIAAVQDSFLTPAIVDRVVAKVLTRAMPSADVDQARATVRARLADVTSELDRLVEGLARAGVSSAVTVAIRKRENAKAALEAELATLERRDDVSQMERQRLETVARQKAKDWSSLLARHTPQARQILAKVLRDKLMFLPEVRDGRPGYRFRGEGSLVPLLAGLVPEFSQAVASPAGFEPALPA
jgi:site-specific DNA recombinase